MGSGRLAAVDVRSRADVNAALKDSFLGKMPAEARDTILAASRVVKIPSRSYFVHIGEPERIGLVVAGLGRAFRVDDEGRELTVAWLRVGSMTGLTSVVQPPSPISAQAVTDMDMLDLPVPLVRQLAKEDAAVALVVASYATAWLRHAVDEIVLYAYGDLRDRVTRRLLELALKAPSDRPFVAPITQDDLAQAVGAARASVARVLKQLRDEGAIKSMYGGILIEKPEALATTRSSRAA
jgi:CRP/FNR family cyclic AMP-dependent transcriptional regulator